MRIQKIILLFLLAILFANCTKIKQYIPKKSNNYIISDENVIISRSDYKIKINGKYAKADKGILLSKFELEVSNIKDSLNFILDKIKLISGRDSRTFKVDRYNHDFGLGNHMELLPNEDYTIYIDFSIEDTTSIEKITDIENVKLSLNGLYHSDNEILNSDIFFSTN